MEIKTYIKTLSDFLNENSSENAEFVINGNKFRAEEIRNAWRIIHVQTGSWFLVDESDFVKAKKNATKVIKDVFKKGDPNFFPRSRDKFRVVSKNGIEFKEGRNKVTAKMGEIITYDNQGEDASFWYLDDNKELGTDYWQYADGSPRERYTAPKVWVMIWNQEIEAV